MYEKEDWALLQEDSKYQIKHREKITIHKIKEQIIQAQKIYKIEWGWIVAYYVVGDVDIFREILATTE